jgi:hypothetical protein
MVSAAIDVPQAKDLWLIPIVQRLQACLRAKTDSSKSDTRDKMGTWGIGTFESDAALDVINLEVDRHVTAIEEILADNLRFRLDEDAEGELMPRIEILRVLCEYCWGTLAKHLDINAWKARYLEMYDDQIDELNLCRIRRMNIRVL